MHRDNTRVPDEAEQRNVFNNGEADPDTTLEGTPFVGESDPVGYGDAGRPMTYDELLSAGLIGTTIDGTPTERVDSIVESAVAAAREKARDEGRDLDPPNPLVTWLNESKTPEEWANTTATAPDGSPIDEAIEAEVVDTFAVIVTFAQERAAGEAPTFEDYYDAREAGINLLRNHPDAVTFSIEKRTSLQK